MTTTERVSWRRYLLGYGVVSAVVFGGGLAAGVQSSTLLLLLVVLLCLVIMMLVIAVLAMVEDRMDRAHGGGPGHHLKSEDGMQVQPPDAHGT